jgi:hypothetical protein
MSTTPPGTLRIVMPVFNDWQAVGQLLTRLDAVLKRHRLRARILLVDDASTESMPPNLARAGYTNILAVEVLALRRNVGNQRAIAAGVAWVERSGTSEALVIMDGDGEDDPEDVPRLVEALQQNAGSRIVFAARMKRSESLTFQCFYHLYRLLHWLLVGVAVRVGNFSIVPANLLPRLVLVPELWNHYAAAVFRSRIPFTSIPTRRAPRLAGRSRVNFVGLIAHGLSAISVFGDVVGVRLLLLTGALGLLYLIAAGTLLASAALAEVALPTWGLGVLGLGGLLLAQLFALGVSFVMTTLSSRSAAQFLPVRDAGQFVEGCQQLYPSRTEEEPIDERRGPSRRSLAV